MHALHRRPGPRRVATRIVYQVEVHAVEPELLEAPLRLVLRVGTSGEELRGDEDLLARHAARADARADRALVLVALCRVDVAVSGLERAGDDPLARAAGVDLPHAQAETGKPDTGRDLDRSGSVTLDAGLCGHTSASSFLSGVRRRIPPRQLWNTISNTISLLPQSGAAAMSSTKERACGRAATVRRAAACSSASSCSPAAATRSCSRWSSRRCPTLQLRLDTTPTGATWVFTAFLLSSAVATPLAGRLGDMYGRRRILLWHARALCRRHPRRRADRLSGRDDRRAGGAGPRRGDLPARLRDHPRRVRRRRRGARDGVDVGRARGRRRARDRARRTDPRAPLLPLAVLGPARGRRRRAGSRPSAWSPSRPAARRRRSWPAAPLLAGWLVCLLVAVSEGPAWGWSSRAGRRPVRGAVVLRSRGSTWRQRARVPLVDLQMLRAAACGRPTSSRCSSGWGMYSAFVLVPQHVEAPSSDGRLRRLGRHGRAVPRAVDGAVAVASAAQRPPLGAVRLAPAADHRRGDRHRRVRVAVVQHGHPWQIIVASTLLGAGTGFAFASMVNLVIESVPPEQTGIATGMHVLMRTLGGAVGVQVAASILSSSAAAGGLPSRARLRDRIRDRDDRARALDGGGTRRARRQQARGAARSRSPPTARKAP